jgi:cytochrome c biogenesis protein
MASKAASLWRKYWQLISSIKTGVILLIVVVIVSAAGTLILQRPMTDPDEMQRAYSPQMLRLLDAVGLTNVFHTWWFVALLVLVSFSIVAASIERFPNAWRYFARPYKSTDKSFRRALGTQRQIAIQDEETGVAAAEQALREMGFRPERVVGPRSMSLFAEKNRISEMAVYIVHTSLLLIFLGGIVDGLLGWNGYVTLVRGQQVNQLALRDGANKTLPFSVRCDGAGQENYQDGSPKKWWSDLAVVENGREVLKKEIVVNDPLVYRGVRFYQASYGMTGKVDKLLLTATTNNGKSQEIALTVGETVQLDPDTKLKLTRFIPDYVLRDGQVYTASESPQNPAVQMFVTSANTGKSVEVWLPEIPGFAHNSESPYKFEARDLQMANYTGLQVSREPGQWAVWAGCLLMGVGLAAAFYFVHVRLWVVPVSNDRGQLTLWVGGTANKNQDVFQEKFAKVVETIEARVKDAKDRDARARLESAAETVAGD